MRMATLALLGSLGLAVSAVSASAAPAVPAIDTQQASNIVQVAGGCGRWAHPNRWGRSQRIRLLAVERLLLRRRNYGGGYPYRHYRSWYGY